MTLLIRTRVRIVTKAAFHMISLVIFTLSATLLPSYLVYRLVYPHESASTYSGGVLFISIFITLIWLVDKLSKLTKNYKQLLLKAKQTNQSKH